MNEVDKKPTADATDKDSVVVEGGNNQIVNSPILRSSRINFEGKNNVLYCESSNIVLSNSVINFKGNNSIVYLSKTKRKGYILSITLYNDSTVYVGRDNYFNGMVTLIASEQKNIIIGSGCLLSFNCSMRTADAHMVYDATTKKRINPSRSILVGDHVWLGQDALLLKGTRIGSGTIVGARSVIAGKALGSNSSYGGNPAKLIKEGVFFPYGSVHSFTAKQTEDSTAYSMKDSHIFSHDPAAQITYEELDEQLSPSVPVGQKLDYLKQVALNDNENRFFIAGDTTAGAEVHARGIAAVVKIRLKRLAGRWRDRTDTS